MAVEQDVFLISVAAELLGMHPQTLRKYERLGLIQPTRTVGSMRLYSRQELEKLRVKGELIGQDTDSLVSGSYLRTLPGVHPCDGFFAAIIEKT